MTLHFYFARRFIMAFLVIAAVLYAMIVLIDAVEQARRFGNLDLGWQRVIGLTLLNAPETINLILPLIMILATVALFISLARSSELVVTRASGRSALTVLLAPATVALLIGLLAVSTLNPIVAATANRYLQLSESYRAGGGAAFSISDEGLWLRQGSKEGQTVIRALRSNPDGSVLYDVTFMSFGPEGGPTQRIEAESAALVQGAWALSQAKSWPIGAGINAEANSEIFQELSLPSTLTPDRIRESIGEPAVVSIYALPTVIRQLDQAGFSPRRHKVWFQTELARPLFLVAMVLVASAFTMRHTRFGGTGVAVLTAVLLGFGLYFIRSFAQILGENGQIPILLAAWAPPLAAILLGLGLLLHVEDG
ncbi:MAG: LPS export ABC transporter permease LptG [Sulfitobacter sp.]|nr:LPS export ABC transporter permease LptG [Sulfitobacter sp.]